MRILTGAEGTTGTFAAIELAFIVGEITVSPLDFSWSMKASTSLDLVRRRNAFVCVTGLETGYEVVSPEIIGAILLLRGK